jgi:beta-lactam-binding protein with PASTA domain
MSLPPEIRADGQLLRKNKAMEGEPHKMPRTHHLALEQVQYRLKAEALPFKLALMQSMAIPKGELIAVSPRPGTSLENGSEIVLTVSSGSPIARP